MIIYKTLDEIRKIKKANQIIIYVNKKNITMTNTLKYIISLLYTSQ